ncbi:MAG: type II secretory pathway protein ExeA, partial [Isosphaeraceae bacterium]
MYESHFGLARRPFLESADPAWYVPLPGHEALLRRLRYALEHSGGPAILHGPGGSGKTLLAR